MPRTCVSLRPVTILWPQRRKVSLAKAFAHIKANFLQKPDKSSAGRIDDGVMDLCAAINQRPWSFTTSSCAGRAVIWRGDGTPPKNLRGGTKAPPVHRLRVSHEPVGRAFLDTATFEAEEEKSTVWLRFEPFVLHACCRDWKAASKLLAAARKGFKHTAVSCKGPGSTRGLRSWRVAVSGDERLEMPLIIGGIRVFPQDPKMLSWLENCVNQKFERNGTKISRFVQALTSAESSTGSSAQRDSLNEH